MNANELADKLEGTAKFINNISNQYHAVREVKEAATMLRQLQARIDELEKLMSDMKYEKSSGVYDLSEEKIANVWLFLEGKAEGVLESGGTFNFPLEFYKAIKGLEK